MTPGEYEKGVYNFSEKKTFVNMKGDTVWWTDHGKQIVLQYSIATYIAFRILFLS